MLTDYYNRYKNLVEEHILDFMPEVNQYNVSLQEAMTYSLQSGGKRIRPVLLLAAAEFCGYDINLALPYAMALEYIHTYSLIHDDLPCMDDDDLRRGQPTSHKKFGEDMAVLAGDGLLTTASEIMMRDMLLYLDDSEKLNSRIRAAYEIIKGAGVRGMVAGQVADIESQGRKCSREYIEYIHSNKTATLLVAALRAGVFLARGDQEKLDALTIYGDAIGLGFQIADDLLDIHGDPEKTGKCQGRDEARSKCTYPLLFGIEDAEKRLIDLTDRALEAVSSYYDEAEFFTEFALDLRDRKG